MSTQEIDNIIEQLNVKDNINLEDIPELDLYMDQVIQLFEGGLSGLKRNDDDKILTKTMINNYAKAKLLMSVKNKKYTKEHLILMSLIYELKGVLSISDIKLLLNKIVQKYENGEEYDLRKLYSRYLNNSKEEANEFIQQARKKAEKLNCNDEFEDKFLLICSMISMSNMYRRMGEKLIDEFFVKDDE